MNTSSDFSDESNRANPFDGLRVAITGGTSGLGLALVRELMERTGWNIAQAARASGVHRKTIERKLKRYNLRRHA